MTSLHRVHSSPAPPDPGSPSGQPAAKRQRREPPTPCDSIVRLNVGGTPFDVARTTLERAGGMLGALASRRWESPHPPQERIFVEADGATFRYVLHFLRHGQVPPLPPGEMGLLAGLADYLQPADLATRLQIAHLNEVASRQPTLENYLTLADALFDAERVPEAQQCHNQAWTCVTDAQDVAAHLAYYTSQVERHPRCPWRLFMRTLSGGQWHDVAATAAKMDEIAPDSFWARYLRAAACIQKEDWHSALDQLGPLAPQSNWAEVHYLWGMTNPSSDARAWANQALALRPAYPEALCLLGDCHTGTGTSIEEAAEAEACYRKALRLRPAYPEAHRKLADVLVEQERYAEADAAYRQAIDLLPNFIVAHYRLGLSLSQQNRSIEAETAFRQALACDTTDNPEAQEEAPGTPTLQTELAAVLSDQRRYREAEQQCLSAIDFEPDDDGPRYQLGRALMGQGQYAAAEMAYREAMRLWPRNIDAYCGCGKALLAQDQPVEAETVFCEALRRDPRASVAMVGRGQALRAQGLHSAAEEAFRAALQLEPTSAAARLGLASALDDQEKHGEAEMAYREALAAGHNIPEVQCGLGLAMLRYVDMESAHFLRALSGTQLAQAMRGGKIYEARMALREALRLRPAYPEALRGMGLAEMHRGDFAAAAARYREALQLKADFPDAHCGLGIVLAEQGQLDAALTSLRAALALRPNYAEARRGMGDVLMRQNNFCQADASYGAAIQWRPIYPEAHCGLGAALAAQGRFVEAEAAYRKALSLRPLYDEARCGLATTLVALGRRNEARTFFAAPMTS